MGFIKLNRSWTKVVFGDKYRHHFVVIAKISIVDIRYNIADAVMAVKNFDINTIVNIAQKQNVDALLANENPELQGELIKLGIKFMTTNLVTAADKKVRKI